MNQKLLTFTFRVNTAEKRAIASAARMLKVPMAEFVRATVLEEAQSLIHGNGAGQRRVAASTAGTVNGAPQDADRNAEAASTDYAGRPPRNERE